MAEQTRIDIIGNYFQKGPASSSKGNMPIRLGRYGSDRTDLYGRTHISQNHVAFTPPGNNTYWCPTPTPTDDWRFVEMDKATNVTLANEYMARAKAPNQLGTSSWENALTVFATLPGHVGAVKPQRDATDTRIINQLLTQTGVIPDTVSQLGGYPVYLNGTPPTDSDHDGMPDAWETARGLNPNLDDSAVLHASGYTMIEVYLNELAGD
ncbi:MAG: hypothetical protein HC841_09040 [Verrucomicrobiae bacterium]|nr:hypothetical protein [Verrucomicrobiae bacterium]